VHAAILARHVPLAGQIDRGGAGAGLLTPSTEVVDRCLKNAVTTPQDIAAECGEIQHHWDRYKRRTRRIMAHSIG
jgi:hypothetical protein